jgi:hypothetical protein
MKKSIYKISLKLIIVLPLLFSLNTAHANGWFGNNTNYFNGYSGNNSYNDWPVWTPMYWMQEMFGNNYNNRYYGNNGRYMSAYGNPYQAQYNNNYQTRLNGYGAYPYSGLYNNAYPEQTYYSNQGYAGYYPNVQYPQNQYQAQYYAPNAIPGMTPFGLNQYNPLARYAGYNNFGQSFPAYNGGMPMNAFGSSAYPSLGFPMRNGLGSTGFGYGSPMSPMSPMSTMPMAGFGGAPFASNGFSPFR